jgi:quinol monooxygenase YgiN
VILEKWESKAALDTHMQTVHFKEYVPMIDSLSDGGVSVNIYAPI